jgi:hypothetical protein
MTVSGCKIVGWAKRSVPTMQASDLERWWARRKSAFAHPTRPHDEGSSNAAASQQLNFPPRCSKKHASNHRPRE